MRILWACYWIETWIIKDFETWYEIIKRWIGGLSQFKMRILWACYWIITKSGQRVASVCDGHKTKKVETDFNEMLQTLFSCVNWNTIFTSFLCEKKQSVCLS